MPHAEESSMVNGVVNGEKPSSKFLTHLASYPVVSDSIEGFKANPYGAKSLSLAAQANETFVAPIVPYARGPYSFVEPYVAKADELAADGLDKVDARFPVVRDDAKTIQDKVQTRAQGLLAAPYDAFVTTKDYLWGTWAREYKHCGGDGVLAGGKALVTGGIAVVSDTLGWVSDFIAGKAKEGEKYIHEKTH